MTEAVPMGTLQAVRGGELEYLPQITMLSLPMICDNLEEVRKLCYSDFVKNMLKNVETEHGMKVLAVGDDSGFRQITNNVRPIVKAEDMKGLKMRTVLEVIDLSIKAFGASTVSVSFTDLYMALKTGVAFTTTSAPESACSHKAVFQSSRRTRQFGAFSRSLCTNA